MNENELLKMADDLVDKVKDIKQKRAQTSKPTLGQSDEGTHEGSFFRTSVVRRPRWSWIGDGVTEGDFGRRREGGCRRRRWRWR